MLRVPPNSGVWSEKHRRGGKLRPVHGGPKSRENSCAGPVRASFLVPSAVGSFRRKGGTEHGEDVMLKKLLLATTIVATTAMPAFAQEKTEFKLAWSIYVGWMPWGYLEDSGIMDKWADKYDIDVEITQINDYIESINQFTAGQYDAVTLTSRES